MVKRKAGKPLPIDVFISHSSADVEVAQALIELIHAACGVPRNAIRCTSITGYRLPAGANTNAQLQSEVHDARGFVGLITPASIQSTYVLFELGARWGAGRQLMPVLALGADSSCLRGPLSGMNALNCSDPGQVQQLAGDLCVTLGTTRSSPEVYQQFVDKLVMASRTIKSENAPPTLPATSPAKKTTNALKPKKPGRFGEDWGKMRLPVKARVGIIDPSGTIAIGLSAIQLDNLGHSGRYNGVIVAFLERKTKASSYNAFGMMAMEGSEVRVSSALADFLGCAVGEDISLEGLAIV